MAKEFDIDSIINPSIQYSFSNSLLEEDDKDIESDLHKIKIFEKQYLIAMGKKRIKQEEGIVYFIAYLVYEDKVVSKLGIYEKKLPPSEIETVGHKTFDFTQEQLILLNKYIANKELLEPYKYVERISKPSIKIILGKETQFSIEEERQKEIIEEIKSMIEIPSDLTEKEMKQKAKFFYKYLTKIKDTFNDKIIIANIRIFAGEKKNIFQFKDKILVSSKIFEEMKQNFNLTYTYLLVLEYVLQVKVIFVANDGVRFNIVSDRKEENIEKFQTILEKEPDYVNFNPEKAIFVTTQGKALKVLTLDGKYIIDFKDMNAGLLLQIYNSFLKDVQETTVSAEAKETRLQAFVNAVPSSEGVEEHKGSNDGDEDEVVNGAQTNAVETAGAETVAVENGGEGDEADEADEAEDGDEDDEGDEGEEGDEADEAANDNGADEETKQEVSKPEVAVNNAKSTKIQNNSEMMRKVKMRKELQNQAN